MRYRWGDRQFCEAWCTDREKDQIYSRPLHFVSCQKQPAMVDCSIFWTLDKLQLNPDSNFIRDLMLYHPSVRLSSPYTSIMWTPEITGRGFALATSPCAIIFTTKEQLKILEWHWTLLSTQKSRQVELTPLGRRSRDSQLPFTFNFLIRVYGYPMTMPFVPHSCELVIVV